MLAAGIGALGGAALALGGARLTAPPEPADGVDDASPGDEAGQATVPFRGAHQSGVATPPQAVAAIAALDLAPTTDREALVRLMRIWTDDAERLMAGRPGLADTEPELATVPARLTVTVGFGPAVFVAAGLEHLRPAWLAPLPAFAVDRLEDAWSGGDLVLQVCADDPVTVSHALRVLVRGARTFATVRWVQRGFRNAPGTVPPGTTVRNLMGQLDGTRNLVPGTADDALIWSSSAGLPWLTGGTSMVLRRIEMNLDTWEALDRAGREAVIGRRLDTGAPLTGTDERDEPDLDAVNALGLPVISDIAHIRRARTSDPTHRFLRRVYSYDDVSGPGGRPSSGLLFVTFQADVAAQFTPVQARLAEVDHLNLWTTPVGSAVFVVPPGCGPGESLGHTLLGA